MNALMTMHPFEPYCYSNVDVTCTLWYEWLHKLIEPNTPVRTRKRQLHPPWITLETSHCLEKLNTLRRKTLRSKVQKPKALNRLEKKCEEMQSADRAEYEDNLFASRYKSKTFKYLKSFQKDPIPPKIEWPEMKVSAVEDFERAELFNKYFTSIVTDNDYKTFEPSRSQVFGNEENEISELLIKENLETLGVSKSRGADNIPPILFIKCSHSIAKSLSLLFQNIERLAKFPKLWKHGIVSPIYKGRK